MKNLRPQIFFTQEPLSAMNTKKIYTNLYQVDSVLKPKTIDQCLHADLTLVRHQFLPVDRTYTRKVLIPDQPWLQSALREVSVTVGGFVRSLRPEFTHMLAVVWHDIPGFGTDRHQDVPGDRGVLQLYIHSGAPTIGTRFYLPSGDAYTFEYRPNTGYLHFDPGLEHEFAGDGVGAGDTRISIYAYFIPAHGTESLIREYNEVYPGAVYHTRN